MPQASQKTWPAKPEDWKTLPATFSEEKIDIAGHTVMWRWAESYMEELAKIATDNGGAILEIGFGFGLSAAVVQRQPIDKHVIIEMNQDVFAHLETFAAQAEKPVEPLFGLWREVAPSLPDASFDGILFDAFPLFKGDFEFHFSFFETAHRLLKPGGVHTYFSGEESDFSARHRQRLQDAGFHQIDKRICAVEPAKACIYWQAKTLVAPIITKS